MENINMVSGGITSMSVFTLEFEVRKVSICQSHGRHVLSGPFTIMLALSSLQVQVESTVHALVLVLTRLTSVELLPAYNIYRLNVSE